MFCIEVIFDVWDCNTLETTTKIILSVRKSFPKLKPYTWMSFHGWSTRINTWKENINNMESGSSVAHCQDKMQWSQNETKEAPSVHQKASTSVLCRWWNTDTSRPEGVLESPPWRYSKIIWAWSWTTLYRCWTRYPSEEGPLLLVLILACQFSPSLKCVAPPSTVSACGQLNGWFAGQMFVSKSESW